MIKSKASKKVRYVFTSDFHLNKLSRFFPNHLDLQFNEMCKPCDYALASGIKTVVVAGDISEDPTLDGPAMTMLLRWLLKYDGLLNIHIVLGNHDFAHVEQHSLGAITELCRSNRMKSTFIYEKPTHIQIEGVHFNMLPFPYGTADKKWNGGPSINVAHLEWEGALRDNGKSSIVGGYTDGDAGIDVWNIGHLHTPQWLKKPRVLYCGTLYQTNFGETLDKSWCDCIAKYSKSSKVLDFSFKRIPSRCAFTLQNLHIEERADFDKIEKNPMRLYKLWMGVDVKIPKSLTTDFPNIIDIRGGKVSEEEQSDFVLEGKELEKLDNKKILSSILRSRGLDKAQRKRAPIILRELGITI